MGANFQRLERHVVMLVRPPRRNANQLRLLLVEHLAIIRVLPQRMCARRRLCPPGLIRISHGSHGNVIPAIEDQIMLMPIIAMPRVADYRRAQFFVRRISRFRCSQPKRSRSRNPDRLFDELPPRHCSKAYPENGSRTRILGGPGYPEGMLDNSPTFQRWGDIPF